MAHHHDLLVFDNVTASYGRRPAVHHVSAALPCGSLCAILGPNGAGKSTLLKAMMGWLPFEGRILIDGLPAVQHRRRIAYVPQRDGLDTDFPLTVAEVVAQGRFQAIGALGGFTAADRAAVDAAIQELGIGDLRDRPISRLSGGQLQRVLLARALATGADIFLLDEPLNGLDVPSRRELLDQLRRWTTDHERIVLAVLHDLDCLAPWFSHALVLRTHLVAAGPVADAASPERLREAFGAEVAAPVLPRFSLAGAAVRR
jgi:manganese/zinc/iron transport system ATP- binding protein